jgi:hypothetical protein
VKICVYTVCMATWHITVNPSVGTVFGTASPYTSIVQRLWLKPVQQNFESEGFTVAPLPESIIGISVSHARASAISQFLLKHDCAGFTILQIV